MKTKTYLPGEWKLGKIIKHTPLLFGNEYVNGWHVNKIEETIIVREPGWQSVYYEVNTGDSILKKDVQLNGE